MFRDNSLIPAEAIRLAALGLLAEAERRYGDLAGEIRHFTSRIVGPSLDLMGTSVELLRYEGLIEAVGLPELWQLAARLLLRGGVVNFFGGCAAGTTVGLDTNLLHYSELTCKASFHHTPALIRKALDVAGRGYVTAKDFVNAVEPLTNLLEVMQHLMSHNGHLQTAIIP